MHAFDVRVCVCACLQPGAAVQFVAYDAVKVCIMAIDPTTGVTSPL